MKMFGAKRLFFSSERSRLRWVEKEELVTFIERGDLQSFYLSIIKFNFLQTMLKYNPTLKWIKLSVTCLKTEGPN